MWERQRRDGGKREKWTLGGGRGERREEGGVYQRRAKSVNLLIDWAEIGLQCTGRSGPLCWKYPCSTVIVFYFIIHNCHSIGLLALISPRSCI
jgi:hypothetical protein